MTAGVEAFERHRGMHVVGGTDGHQIDIAGGQHVGGRQKRLDPGEICGGNRQAGGIDVGHGHRNHARMPHLMQVMAGDIERSAVADDADFDI